MTTFYLKSDCVEARRFETNNEPDDKNMNDICIWANQGRYDPEWHCWHNGTDICVMKKGGSERAVVGDWIVRDGDGKIWVVKDGIFRKRYGVLPLVKGEGA
ncbi:hypothetical protein [Bradyrhizobium sp. Tv2a-2]|uniref:hypothetical protein n=1 Tax=Bradyrhizobium sp. Tv2a-2 TaxID=113395 RepID=UPI0003F5FC20|nr:hypothetical protein [Bradyrhizobium sp. Tv2a-2]